MSSDLKDFFLENPMARPEFMRVPFKYFSQEIIATYNIRALVEDDGYVYVQINKDMYGLKQAAIIAYIQLVKHLKPHGYSPMPYTTGLWRHATRKTKFSSVLMILASSTSARTMPTTSCPHWNKCMSARLTGPRLDIAAYPLNGTTTNVPAA